MTKKKWGKHGKKDSGGGGLAAKKESDSGQNFVQPRMGMVNAAGGKVRPNVKRHTTGEPNHAEKKFSIRPRHGL